MKSRLPILVIGLGIAATAFTACGPSSGSSSGSHIGASGGATASSGGAGGATGSSGAGGGGTGGAVISLPDAGSGGTVGAGGACVDCGDAGPGCGNGVLDPGEACDDGDTESGDGCVATCTAVEQDYACPLPGEACVSTVKCGDALVTGAETCDDRNAVDGDGCSATCTVEDGWRCPNPGQRCIAARCGDGILAGREQCDDGPGGADAGDDGCDASCHRQPGWACGAPGTPCHRTACGDGTREGDEQCDDGNPTPYDGCSPTCGVEPKCSGGTCSAVCGDGLVFPQEACDDGNTDGGDGCSATCTKEDGFVCQTETLSPPDQLVIPILYRDFLYKGTTVGGTGHPDFEAYNGARTGLVQDGLDAEGKPIFLSSQGVITDATSFYWWYHDLDCTTQPCTQNPYAKTVYLDAGGRPTTLTLGRLPGGEYQFSSSSFFPVDNLGYGTIQTYAGHNFSFTSELRYPFTYQGGEVLSFSGDDDVWVFINGKLAVDIGGVHGETARSITLDATAATNLGLVAGGMYEIAVFQAERHTSGSNYKLTLSGFVRAVTQCKSVCGDGIVVADEVCDDGKNDGSYGSCAPDCSARGAYCGDGILQPAYETCDDGLNLSPYGGCAPGCVPGNYCGDGKVDSRFGEQCDDGTNAGAYGGCAPDCRLAGYCGDGVTQPEEQCDEGPRNGQSSCSNTCKRNAPQ